MKLSFGIVSGLTEKMTKELGITSLQASLLMNYMASMLKVPLPTNESSEKDFLLSGKQLVESGQIDLEGLQKMYLGA